MPCFFRMYMIMTLQVILFRYFSCYTFFRKLMVSHCLLHCLEFSFYSLGLVSAQGQRAQSTLLFNPQMVEGKKRGSFLFQEHYCKSECKRLGWNLNLATGITSYITVTRRTHPINIYYLYSRDIHLANLVYAIHTKNLVFTLKFSIVSGSVTHFLIQLQ